MAIPAKENYRIEPEGAQISLEQLIQLRYSAKDLSINNYRQTHSLAGGTYKTRFRGRGMEFEEVRIYQAGDDVRSIDWRVTARTQKPHTKLYQEERERPVFLVVDQSESMKFGSRKAFKSVIAASTASLLAWAALGQGDRVGGFVFNDSTHDEIKPKRSKHTVLHWLQKLADYNNITNIQAETNTTQENKLLEVLKDLRHVAKPGSAIFISSDFSKMNDQCAEQLHQLSKHCDLYCLYIVDPLEMKLPPAGHYSVSDGQQTQTINTSKAQYRKNYEQHFQQQQESLTLTLNRIGIPLLELSTQSPIITTLRQVFGRINSRQTMSARKR